MTEIPMTKTNNGLEFGACNLEFIWNLVLGIWNFNIIKDVFLEAFYFIEGVDISPD